MQNIVIINGYLMMAANASRSLNAHKPTSCIIMLVILLYALTVQCAPFTCNYRILLRTIMNSKPVYSDKNRFREPIFIH